VRDPCDVHEFVRTLDRKVCESFGKLFENVSSKLSGEAGRRRRSRRCRCRCRPRRRRRRRRRRRVLLIDVARKAEGKSAFSRHANSSS